MLAFGVDAFLAAFAGAVHAFYISHISPANFTFLVSVTIGEPDLVVMDEPSLGLSPILIDDYFRIATRIRDAGAPVLLIEQNAKTALSIPARGHLLIRTILATRYFPPDLAYVADAGFLRSAQRTLEMSMLGGFLDVVCSIPLAWLAARNITVSRRIGYPFGRLAIMGSRSIHETIWTILFVTVLGFGMLAGTLALTLFCIGFAGKLFSDELEAIDMGPVEALRSVGASLLQVFRYAVLPQVRVAFTGIAIYIGTSPSAPPRSSASSEAAAWAGT